jgi:hypothetical protein
MIIRLGDHGENVALLQRRLTRAGFTVDVSHVFDDATERAVDALQSARGLVVDGIVGDKTLTTLLSGTKSPKLLGDQDIVNAARKLGIEEAAIRAVNEVESAGKGFQADGRPIILFERHVFYDRLKQIGINPAPIAVKSPNICNPVRGGYSGGPAEYTRLASAQHVDVGTAYESASWGAFQIMGYHWKDLGYSEWDEFISCMETDEASQLDAFVRFILADAGLLAALRAKKWTTFAKGYNGPNYAANLYDVKLSRAYDRYTNRLKVAA